MNTYKIYYTRNDGPVNLIYVDAKDDLDAWSMVQEDYAGHKCTLMSIEEM